MGDMYHEYIGKFFGIDIGIAWNKVMFFYKSVYCNVDCITAIRLW
jgi:hypothetical protein